MSVRIWIDDRKQVRRGFADGVRVIAMSVVPPGGTAESAIEEYREFAKTGPAVVQVADMWGEWVSGGSRGRGWRKKELVRDGNHREEIRQRIKDADDEGCRLHAGHYRECVRFYRVLVEYAVPF